MNSGTLSTFVRFNPALWISRALIHRSSGCRPHLQPVSSLPSSPVRSTQHLQRRQSHPSNGVSSSDLVKLDHRRPFATVARAIGSSAGNVNANSSTNSYPPPPDATSAIATVDEKPSPSDLLDEALRSAVAPQPETPAIVVADSCVKRLKEIDESSLRVVVEGGGCSGFQYKFELGVEVDPAADLVFEKDGIRVIVDESSLELIRGSVVEFHTELIRSAFRISANPLAEKGCSCGASFSVKF